MAAFVQIVEFHTSRLEELKSLSEELSAQTGGTVLRRTVTADRDRPGHYYTIIEFDSYESAMQHSARPETSQFAARMAELCDGPPTFHNLDVIDTWTSESGGPSKTAMVAGAATAAAGVAAATAAVKSKSGNEAGEQEVVEVEYNDVTAAPTPDTVDYRDDEGRTL